VEDLGSSIFVGKGGRGIIGRSSEGGENFKLDAVASEQFSKRSRKFGRSEQRGEVGISLFSGG